jgi:membrane-bound lytic murein transglycosylase B
MKILNPLLCFFLANLISFNCLAAVKQQEAVNEFIHMMVTEHQFDQKQLENLFQQVEIKEKILETISSPAEGLPWYKYRKIFITDSRIDGGVKFWQENEQALATVEQQYGVPAEIIVAIIGVETRYGGNTGNHRIIDALSTLAFAYPKRSQFFLSELEHFLILCREENMNPLDPTGSYAGAMGVPQFMPSSYRAYAADFDDDNLRDIWKNQGDVIASIANYFNQHQWQTGKEITFPVSAVPKFYKQALSSGLKPNITVDELNTLGVRTPKDLDASTKVRLLAFATKNGDELWIGLENFYVITRYNHSPLYAMAVFQLSQAILESRAISDS